MKAVIFAAGEGKRLRPLTEEKPKPLVEVLGKPIIQYVWEALPREVDEVVVVVGYKKEEVKKFLGDKFLGKRVVYVEQDKPLGTAHALNLCKTLLEGEEKFLLMYADDIHGADSIERCIAHAPSLLVHYIDDPRRFGVIVRNSDGTVQDIEEKPEHPKSNLAVTGVYVLTPEIFQYKATQSKGGECYLTDMIRQYIQTFPLHVVESDLWIPIAYPEDVKRAEEILVGLPHK